MANIRDIISSLEQDGVKGVSDEITEYRWSQEDVGDTCVSVTIWLKRELPEEESRANEILSELSTKERYVLFNKLREEGYDA